MRHMGKRIPLWGRFGDVIERNAIKRYRDVASCIEPPKAVP